MNIKPIETFYDGYMFRSRLEARWAVFFNCLVIKYLYEHEGFDLGDSQYYLPDFYLQDLKSWIEIKGVDPTEDEKIKIKKLHFATGLPCFIFSGLPNDHESYGWFREITNSGSGGSICTDDTDCNSFKNRFGINSNNIAGFTINYCDDRIVVDNNWIELDHFSECFYPSDPNAQYAYIKAKSARFEHGQEAI